jgi:hypothetical protein
MLSYSRALLASAAALASLSGVTARPQGTGTGSGSGSGMTCNNSPTLCDRQYNNVTHMGAHDAAFLRDDSTGNSISGNQFFNATVALDAGLRLLQSQVHDENGVLQLCHTSCGLLDAGPLENWLATINTWMEQNPDEVVTILLVNADDNLHGSEDFGAAFNSSGLSQFAYNPQTTQATSNWPTLGEMISANTRLVSFVSNVDPSPNYPFILNQFNFVFETPFENTAPESFSCTLDRAIGPSTAEEALSRGFLSLVNHFLYSTVSANLFIPDVNAIDTTNSAGGTPVGTLGSHVADCNQQWGTRPNFVLVDFFSRGDPVSVADVTNGVGDATGRTDPNQANGSDQGVASKTSLGQAALLTFMAAFVVLV